METTFFEVPLFIKHSGKLIGVMPKDIVCVEANRAYCNIYVSGRKKPFELSCSMGSAVQALPEGFLKKIGRAYSVNICHIREIDECHVTMDNGFSFTVGKKAMNDLRSSIIVIG